MPSGLSKRTLKAELDLKGLRLVGMLTGTMPKPEDLPEGDFRRHEPRFQPEAYAAVRSETSLACTIQHILAVTRPLVHLLSWVSACVSLLPDLEHDGDPISKQTL